MSAILAREMWEKLPREERLKAVKSFEALEEHAGNDWAALPPELQSKIIASMQPAEEHPTPARGRGKKDDD